MCVCLYLYTHSYFSSSRKHLKGKAISRSFEHCLCNKYLFCIAVVLKTSPLLQSSWKESLIELETELLAMARSSVLTEGSKAQFSCWPFLLPDQALWPSSSTPRGGEEAKGCSLSDVLWRAVGQMSVQCWHDKPISAEVISSLLLCCCPPWHWAPTHASGVGCAHTEFRGCHILAAVPSDHMSTSFSC